MTIRALLIGLVLATAIAAYGYANDWALTLPYVAADLMPIGAYGLLMVAILLVNPLLRLVNLRLSRSELAVIFALMVTASVIPGAGLLWQFHNPMIMPLHAEETQRGWNQPREGGQARLLDYVPPVMLVNDGKRAGGPNPDPKAAEIYSGFYQGLGGKISLSSPEAFGKSVQAVPWKAWKGPYGFYLPLVALSFIAAVAMALVVHRQWSYREHLKYPIAEVTSELIEAGAGERPLFRDGFFWLGFGVAGAVLLINGLATLTDKIPRVPIGLDLNGLLKVWPRIDDISPEGYWLLEPKVFFAVVGLAFLLSSDASFSLGISSMLWGVVFLGLTDLGVDMSRDYMSGGVGPFQLFGSFVGAALVIAYTGRRFYWQVLRRALCLSRTGDRVEPSEVWGARVALLAGAAMVVLLRVMVGLDLLLAIAAVMLIGLMFVVVTRINCETGILFVQPGWQAVGVLLALFGAHALGPRALIILGLLSAALAIDPRVCLMPLAANALRVADTQKLKAGPVGGWMVVGLLIALAVAVPVTLYLQYHLGPKGQYSYANEFARMNYDMLKLNVDNLSARDQLATAGQAHAWGGLERLLHLSPSGKFLLAGGAGLALVLAVSLARLRWPWWPIHPVLFLVWGTIASSRFAVSYLVGWFLKSVINKYGGGMGYRRARPFFIGLIAGEIAVAILWIAVGALWYSHYGAAPKPYRVHP